MYDQEHRYSAVILTLVFIGCMFYMAFKTLEVIRSIPQKYFNSLPVSNTADFDRDGIPDYIDDSDGDGIPDDKDISPYGRGSRVLLSPLKIDER